MKKAPVRMVEARPVLPQAAIGVVEALRLRDEARVARKPLPIFICKDCGAAVTPHRGGSDHIDHFEHLPNQTTCKKG